MLVEIAEHLDAWVIAQNLEARAEGLPGMKPCRIRLLGQSALFELRAPLNLTLTNDVDVYADYEHAIEREFARLLAKAGKQLDAHGHEIWMPQETRYTPLFGGRFVSLEVADVDSVLVSKALKAPDKNGPLIVEYLARGASERFLSLAGKYRLDLEQFV